MKGKSLNVLLATAIVVAVLILLRGNIGLADAAEPCGSTVQSIEGPPFDGENVCTEQTPQTGTMTNPAMQAPDQFAWEKFAELNRPANNKAGQVVAWWRTWPEQADVYVANPNPVDPPQWEKISGLDQLLAGHPSVQLAAANPGIRLNASAVTTNTIDQECQALNNNQVEEARLNQEHVEYVVANDLWYVEGKQAAFAKKLKVNFPTGAIEIKANWIPLGDDHDPSTYYTVADATGKLWGLVAMHLMTKDIPNWVWATFEHKDNPCYNRYLTAQDTFGLDAKGEPSQALLALFKQYGIDAALWSNYRLDGVQVDFTNAMGQPIILGNSVTEFGFQTTSSCMTCHARATTNVAGNGSLSVFDPHNQSYHGAPDPEWYFSSLTPPSQSYLPLDFSWAVALCPNSINSKPSDSPNCSKSTVDQ